MPRRIATSIAIALLGTSLGIAAGLLPGCSQAPLTAKPPVPALNEPRIPAPTAPPIRQVRGQLLAGRAGTGIPVPLQLHLGTPVRIFALNARASGSRVQDLIDPARVTLYYPILSSKGLEGELTYRPWNPESFKDGGVGDFGKAVQVSTGGAAQYEREIAALPSVGASPVVGILPLGVEYDLAVAWTPTASVGVAYPSGRGGAILPGAKPEPSIPTGVPYRDGGLTRLILSHSSRP